MKLKIMIMVLLLLVMIGSAVNWLPESTMERGANVTFQDGGGIEDAGFVNTTVLNADSMGPTSVYGNLTVSGEIFVDSIATVSKVYGPYTFDHSDGSPIILFQIPNRCNVKRVYVESTENSSGVDWDIGISTDVDLFVANYSMPRIIGDMVMIETTQDAFFSSATNATLNITTAGSSGSGRVWFEIVKLLES